MKIKRLKLQDLYKDLRTLCTVLQIYDESSPVFESCYDVEMKRDLIEGGEGGLDLFVLVRLIVMVMGIRIVDLLWLICVGFVLAVFGLFSLSITKLGACDIGVAAPIALVYAGLMTSGDARPCYMISGDAKSWD
ncbi:hypothetical protein Tco_0146286 [Tanacetum coccineum]